MADGKDKTAFLQQSPFAAKPAAGTNKDAVLLSIYPTGNGMGRRFALNKAEHVLGRADDVDITLEGEGLSRRHARISRDDHAWYVEDLGSTNGTHVNDRRITKQPLNDGDLIRTGVAICKFLSGDNIEAAYHEEIYRMSIMDGLTNVHNKRYFLEFLDRELSSASRHGTPLTLIMVDIDFFKKINDTYGHLAGDAALKELCRRLAPRLRKEDLLARYGGEEFAVVLPNTPREGGLQVGETLRAIVEATPFTYDTATIPATISLGLATIDPAAPGTPVELIKRADENLYEAKRSGRNRIVG